ncbi:MAG: endonuclease Q family protein [bacterium]|nr:endonuclease Q family protein [bacterium]
MFFIADLHIHSPYSRATSKEMNLENLYRWAQLKGITVLGTGDFTHPRWFAEIQEKLEPAEPGLFRLRPEYCSEQDARIPNSCRGEVRFLLSAEVSSIYSKNGRTRKVHNLLFAPGLEIGAEIRSKLQRIGNLSSDGRPILGLDSKVLLQIVLEASPEAFLVPAHAWTPHFSVFGSNSGFDSMEECFEDLTPHIFAIETGLSSDPAMNRRLSKLDKITLISNSDAHSLAKLGREANLFNTELSYYHIRSAMETRDVNPKPDDPQGQTGLAAGALNPKPETGKPFEGTIEFFPEEGKYHLDGHRACDMRMSPEETRRHEYSCPKCGRKATVGVLHRVEALADRPEGFILPEAPTYQSLIPLLEIISEIKGVGVNSKKVAQEYERLLSHFGPELSILRETTPEEIEGFDSPLLAEAIRRVRAGGVKIAAGYDGEYGKVQVFGPGEKETFAPQMSLF